MPRQSGEKPLSRARQEAGEIEVSMLVRDLGTMIEAARKQVAVAANAALTTLHWQLGHRLRTKVLEGQRAVYGGQIVSVVGKQLEARYGRGFGEKNLRRMVQFAAVFPDPAIVAALLRELGWTHFTLLIPIKDAKPPLTRCRRRCWRAFARNGNWREGEQQEERADVTITMRA